MNPRLVWCPSCRAYSPAPRDGSNTCVRCGQVSSICRCTRCGTEWRPRKPIKEGRPLRCYICNSPYFDRERVRKVEER